MALSTRRDASQHISDAHTMYDAMFPASGLLETPEQIRRFELLRLAFFALKLRKLEQRSIGAGEEKVEGATTPTPPAPPAPPAPHDEQEFRRSLLRHVIFQQILTLIQLDARSQAMQIIEACQK
jgi:hypothetical protein